MEERGNVCERNKNEKEKRKKKKKKKKKEKKTKGSTPKKFSKFFLGKKKRKKEERKESKKIFSKILFFLKRKSQKQFRKKRKKLIFLGALLGRMIEIRVVVRIFFFDFSFLLEKLLSFFLQVLSRSTRGSSALDLLRSIRNHIDFVVN